MSIGPGRSIPRCRAVRDSGFRWLTDSTRAVNQSAVHRVAIAGLHCGCRPGYTFSRFPPRWRGATRRGTVTTMWPMVIGEMVEGESAAAIARMDLGGDPWHSSFSPADIQKLRLSFVAELEGRTGASALEAINCGDRGDRSI